MWPLVQSGDACTFYPIQAVTAKKGRCVTINKEESEIEVGDIVFCRVQPTWVFYAHIVLAVTCDSRHLPQYTIGNILGRENGWCNREHIYGILQDVQVFSGDGAAKWVYYKRPHPKTRFAYVAPLVRRNRWSQVAADLCVPKRKQPPSQQASSSGQQNRNSAQQG